MEQKIYWCFWKLHLKKYPGWALPLITWSGIRVCVAVFCNGPTAVSFLWYSIRLNCKCNSNSLFLKQLKKKEWTPALWKFAFSLVHIPSTYTEAAGLMTCTATRGWLIDHFYCTFMYFHIYGSSYHPATYLETKSFGGWSSV